MQDSSNQVPISRDNWNATTSNNDIAIDHLRPKISEFMKKRGYYGTCRPPDCNIIVQHSLVRF